MALGSTQPLTEMSTRNLKKRNMGVKGGQCIGLTTLLPSGSCLSKKCGSLKLSQPKGLPQSVGGLSLPFFFVYLLLLLLSKKRAQPVMVENTDMWIFGDNLCLMSL
jgi:hypothetical protein